MTASRLFVAVATFLAACRTTLPQAGGGTHSSSESSWAARPATISERMKYHDLWATQSRDAIIRDDLPAARRAASSLARIPAEDAFDAVWNQKLGAMRAAAARVADSPDLTAASRRIADLAVTCGDCHSGFGGLEESRSPPAHALDSRPRSKMRSHAIAVGQLWDGLVNPSEDAWGSGAQRLSDPSLAAEMLTPGRTPVPKVGELVASVRDLGERAAKASTPGARAEIYAGAIGTCATCHRWFGSGPPAP
jgi:cytochrome c553